MKYLQKLLFLTIFIGNSLNLISQTTNNGLTIILNNGKYGMIDELNNIRVETEYDSIYIPRYLHMNLGKSYFSRAYQSKDLELYIGKKNGLYCYIIPSNKNIKDWHISPTKYLSIIMPSTKKPILILKSKKGLSLAFLKIEKNHKFVKGSVSIGFNVSQIVEHSIIETKYDSIFSSIDNKTIGIYIGGKYGIIYNKKEVIPPTYDSELFMINDSLIIASKNGGYGVLKNFVPATPFKYKREELVQKEHFLRAEAFNLFDNGNELKFLPFNKLDEHILTVNSKSVAYDERWDYGSLLMPYNDSTNLLLVSGKIREDHRIPSSFPFSYFRRNYYTHLIVYNPKTNGEIKNYFKPNCKYYYKTGFIVEFEYNIFTGKTLIARYYEAGTGVFAFQLVAKKDSRSFPYKLKMIDNGYEILYDTGNSSGKTYGYIRSDNYQFYKSEKKFLEE